MAVDEDIWAQCQSAIPLDPPSELPAELGRVDGNRVILVDSDEVMVRPDQEEDAEHPHMDFLQGGNDLEARWIAREYGSNVILLDGEVKPSELPYVAYHEAVERRAMAGGMDYDTAHSTIANPQERELRRRDMGKSMNYLEQIKERQSKAPFLGTGFAHFAGEKAAYSDPSAGLDATDESKMTAAFLITTAAKDRHGDTVQPLGCQDHLKEYERNPVVLLNHDHDGLPIATSANPDGSLALEFTPRGIIARAYFHGKTRASDEAFALVSAGILRGASIGFAPIEADVHEGKMEKLEDGGVIKFEPYISFNFTKWSLLEWSVVAVPANAEAVRLSIDKGFDGKPLSEAMRRYLEPFAEKRKLIVPGFTPAKSDEAPLSGDLRAPHKPGEKFVGHLVKSLSNLAMHCDAAATELDHPGICEMAVKAAGQFRDLKDHYSTKGGKHYPDVDFDKSVEEIEIKINEPVVSVPQVDTSAILEALKSIEVMQSSVARKLYRHTGR